MGMLQYLRLTPCRVEYTLFLFLHILNTTKLPYLNHTFVILNNLHSYYFKNIPDFEERNGVDLCLFLKFDSLYAIAFNDPFFCTELFQHSLFFFFPIPKFSLSSSQQRSRQTRVSKLCCTSDCTITIIS